MAGGMALEPSTVSSDTTSPKKMQTGKGVSLYAKKATPSKMLSAKWYIQSSIATLLGAIYIVSAVKPARMDADLVVSSLASLINPTLYYWGQDRLFSVIPIMLLPFRNIEWNLYLNTLFQAAFFTGLVLLILHSISGKSNNIWILLMAAIFSITYTIPKPELFTFAKHSQPYASSTAALIASYCINLRATRLVNSRLHNIASTVLSIVALLLNPLTIVFGLSLSFAELLESASHSWKQCRHDINSNLRWISILLSGTLVAYVSKFIYSRNYDIEATPLGISPSGFTPALKITVEHLMGSFHGNFIAIALAVIGFLMCLYPFLNIIKSITCHKIFGINRQIKLHKYSSTGMDVYPVIACAAIFNLLSLLPILSSEWYRLNDYSLRYLFPLYLAIIIGLCRASIYVCQPLLNSSILNQQRMLSTQILPEIRLSLTRLILASLITSILIGSYRPIAPSLISYNEFSRVSPVYRALSEEMQENMDIFIGGSYWLSWPLKALSLNEGRDIGVLTDRSRFDPPSRLMEDILDDKIRKSDEFTFICLSETPEIDTCANILQAKIDRLSSNPKSWNFNVPTNPDNYSIHGETYVTRMQYKISRSHKTTTKAT